ncbi:hypothetical protein GGX14DRAFT_650109 [Mycena pura]|uniref:Uncharacterized protein n=1 Tax=Mycena pura TaxID=153505 RepID=A0AAD7E275_9AGAR|nr:hypothetical protein GGX14DRAFT_650109 [Mycena pura]
MPTALQRPVPTPCAAALHHRLAPPAHTPLSVRRLGFDAQCRRRSVTLRVGSTPPVPPPATPLAGAFSTPPPCDAPRRCLAPPAHAPLSVCGLVLDARRPVAPTPCTSALHLAPALELFPSLSSPQSNAWLIPAESTVSSSRLIQISSYDLASAVPHTAPYLCPPRSMRLWTLRPGGWWAHDLPSAQCSPHLRRARPADCVSASHACTRHLARPYPAHCPFAARGAQGPSLPLVSYHMHPPSAACRLLLASCRFLHTTCCSLAASPSTARYQMFATCRPRSHGTQRMCTRTRTLPALHCALPKKHRTPCGALYPPGARCRALVQGVGATGRRASRTSPHTLNGACAGGARQRRGASQGGGVENAPARGVAGGGTGGGRAHTERNRMATALGIKTEPAHAQRSVCGRRKAVMQGGGAGRRRGALQGGGHRERACARSTERARVVQGGGVGQGSDVGHGRAAAASKTSPPGAFQGGGGTGASKTSPRTLNGACGVGAGRRRGAFQGSGHRERSHARSTERARAVQGGGMGQGNGVGHGSVRGWRHKYGGQKVYEKLALKQREHRKRRTKGVPAHQGRWLMRRPAEARARIA